MKDKYEITIFTTTLSILFVVMMQFAPNYSNLLLNLEVISLPVIYILGYEIMMEKQRFKYIQFFISLENKIQSLNKKNKKLKDMIQNETN